MADTRTDPDPARCGCGWTPDADPTTGHCHLCHEPVQGLDALAHLRIHHPDVYGYGPLRWPDGAPVVVDDTLTPEDFT